MNGDSLKEIIGLAYDYQIELSEESDRGAAILAAANFEEWLGSIISGYLSWSRKIGQVGKVYSTG